MKDYKINSDIAPNVDPKIIILTLIFTSLTVILAWKEISNHFGF